MTSTLPFAGAGQPRDRGRRDEEADQDQEGRLGERSEVLCLAVAILVADVRGTTCDAEREEREQRRDEVGSRVGRLGDEAKAACRKADDELQRNESRGRTDRDERRAPLWVHGRSLGPPPAEAGLAVCQEAGL